MKNYLKTRIPAVAEKVTSRLRENPCVFTIANVWGHVVNPIRYFGSNLRLI